MPSARAPFPHAKRIALSLSFAGVLAVGAAVMTGVPKAVPVISAVLVLLGIVCLPLRKKAVVRRVLFPMLIAALLALLRFGLAYRDTVLYSETLLDTYRDTPCVCEGYAKKDAAANGALYLELYELDGTPLMHRTAVYTANNTGDHVREGDAIRCTAMLVRPQNGKNADFDFAGYLTTRGICIQLKKTSDFAVNVSRSARVSPGAFLRRFVTDRLDEVLGTLGASDSFSRTFGLTKALLFGDKGSIADDDYDAFRRCGITHLLCVSGMHFAVVFGMLSLLLSYLTQNTAVRRVILLAAAVGYLTLCGFSLSAVRAAVMAAAGGFSVGRSSRTDGVYRLLLAASLILLIFPYAVLDTGFHLSFIATFGILCTASVIARIPSHGSEAVDTALKSVLSFFLVPIGAFVFTAPYSIAAFGGVSTVALAASCLTVYPAEVLLCIAWIAVLLCVPFRLFPTLSFLTASLMEAFADFICRTAQALAAWRYAYLPLVVSLPSLALWLSEALLAAALNVHRGKRAAAVIALTVLVPLSVAFALIVGTAAR